MPLSCIVGLVVLGITALEIAAALEQAWRPALLLMYLFPAVPGVGIAITSWLAANNQDFRDRPLTWTK